MVSEIAILLPFFIFISFALAGLRRGENLLKNSSWQTGAYIRFNMMQYMLPVSPFLFLSGMLDAVGYFPAIEEFGFVYVSAATGALALFIVIFMALSPFLLRLFWKNKPLEQGELRQNLEKIANESGVKIGGILIWQTDGGVANGLVTGIFYPLRYVFLTDGLIAKLTPKEIESVFAHEMGHAKYRHILIYLLIFISFIFVMTYTEEPAMQLAGYADDLFPDASSVLYSVYSLGFLFFFWFVIFGYISRRLEQSADIYAVEKVGAEPFVSALERLVGASGGKSFLSTWRHFSAEKRAKFALDWQAGQRKNDNRFLIVFLSLLFVAGLLLFSLQIKNDLTLSESDTLASRALFRQSKEDYSEAEKLMRAAVEKSPKDAKYRYFLGQILLRNNRDEEAVSEFETAASLAPNEKFYRRKISELRGY